MQFDLTPLQRLGLVYSQEREQFRRPICEFQGVQWMLADIATQIAAAQLLIYKAAARRRSCAPSSPPGYSGDGCRRPATGI